MAQQTRSTGARAAALGTVTAEYVANQLGAIRIFGAGNFYSLNGITTVIKYASRKTRQFIIYSSVVMEADQFIFVSETDLGKLRLYQMTKEDFLKYSRPASSNKRGKAEYITVADAKRGLVLQEMAAISLSTRVEQ